MELKDLIGLCTLDAVDFQRSSQPRYEGSDDFEDCSSCRFRLNGTVYVAMEDPSDGYRSHMRDLIVERNAEITNVFPPVQVLARYRGKSGYNDADILELIDVATTLTVLEVGTDNSDDYYPSYVANFQPENMASNADATKVSP